MHGQTTLKF